MKSFKVLSVEKSRLLDRAASHEFSIPTLTLMENSGHHLTEEIKKMGKTLQNDFQVFIFCGGGNNGGDGFAAARRLDDEKIKTTVYSLVPNEKLKGDARKEHEIINKRAGLIIPFSKSLFKSFEPSPPHFVILDALLGTGFKGEVKPPIKDAIEIINNLKNCYKSQVKIISADLPSGLDGDKGPLGGAIVKADLTVSFACAKPGLIKKDSVPYVGKMKVVDIGIPRQLIEKFSSKL